MLNITYAYDYDYDIYAEIIGRYICMIMMEYDVIMTWS